jgi:hypothetical protein
MSDIKHPFVDSFSQTGQKRLRIIPKTTSSTLLTTYPFTMKTFTPLFVFLILSFGSAAGPQTGLHDGRADDPRSVPGLHDGRADDPRSVPGLHDGRADDPRSVLGLHDTRTNDGPGMPNLTGFDILDFVMALSAQRAGAERTAQQAGAERTAQRAGAERTAQQAGTALAGKSQAYTMTLDSLHGTSREIGTHTWVNSYRVVYVYDDFMRPIEFSDYSRDSDADSWKPFSRTVLTYNEQGWLSGLSRSLNTLGDGIMYEHLIMEVFYDNAGRVDSLVTHSATDLQEINRSQVELFTYDEEGRPERVDILTRNINEELWYQGRYKLITHDGDGRRLHSVVYNIGKDGESHLYSQQEYVYDAEGRLAVWVTHTYNYARLQVEPFSKREYVYSDDGDHSKSLVYVFENDEWGPYSLAEYTYDPTIRYADVATPGFIYPLLYDRIDNSQPDEKMLTEAASYFYLDGDFVLAAKYVYYVSDKSAEGDKQVTMVEDLNLAAPALYPNPAGDHIRLEWEGAAQERLTLEVYHITGALVMRREVESGQQLSIDQLQTGLYLYRLSDGHAIIQAGRLVKR